MAERRKMTEEEKAREVRDQSLAPVLKEGSYDWKSYSLQMT